MKNASSLLTSATLGFGFDDIFLAPRLSPVEPADVEMAVQIGPLRIQRPFWAAAMERMGSIDFFIAVARAGGIAIIPRWEHSRRVKALCSVKAIHGERTGESIDCQGRLCAAVSVNATEVELVPELIEMGADAVVLESAHGGSASVLRAAAAMRGLIPSQVAFVAGNIATADAATQMAAIGVDAVKVGVGVGSLCTSTEVTGVGMPQISALAEVSDAVKSRVSVIADGGVRNGGDIVKAFALGANSVCIGSLFAQSEEAAGEVRNNKDGKAFRLYAANFYPSLSYDSFAGVQSGEGLEGWLPVSGSVASICNKLSLAAKAGMAYLGASEPGLVQENARLIVNWSTNIAAKKLDRFSDLKQLAAPFLQNV